MRAAVIILSLLLVGSLRARSGTFSSNIVGYVTLSLPPGYSLIANPLSTGTTNGANEMGLQISGAQILTFNGTGYNFASYDESFGGWIDVEFKPADPPALPPGLGFFFFNPLSTPTNITFIGQVVPGPGQTNCLIPPIGYSLLGSPLPADVADISSPPVSLPLGPGEQVLAWNGTGFVYSSWEPDFGGWVDADFKPKAAPAYHIGQGFFVFSPADWQWCQNLP